MNKSEERLWIAAAILILIISLSPIAISSTNHITYMWGFFAGAFIMAITNLIFELKTRRDLAHLRWADRLIGKTTQTTATGCDSFSDALSNMTLHFIEEKPKEKENILAGYRKACNFLAINPQTSVL